MSKTTVNEKNLRALGEKRLSKLLLSLASEHPMEKLRLRYTLFHEFEPYHLEGELKKRLNDLTKNLKKTPPAKVPALLEEFSLQSQIIPLLKATDPLQALKHQFDLLGALRKLMLIMYDKNNKRFAHAQDLATHLLPKFLDQLTALILEHPPEGEWLAHEFLNLPRHGGRCFRLLDDTADTLGPQKLETIEKQAHTLHQKYQDIEDSRDHTQEEERSYFWLCDLLTYFSIFKRDTETYLYDKRQDDYASLEELPLYLAKVARELMDEDLYKSAEACLTSIPNPPPEEITHPWYLAYNTVLRGLGKKEQARKMRWQCFTSSPDADLTLFYLDPWLPRPHSDHTTKRFEEEVDRVEKFLMEEVSPSEALLICFDLRDPYILLEDIFGSVLLYHHQHLHKHPDIPWEEFVHERESYNPLIQLIVWREYLKQRKAKKGSWSPELAQELNSMISTIKDLDSRMQGDDYYNQHMISHSEFMKNLKKSTSSSSSPRPKNPRASRSL